MPSSELIVEDKSNPVAAMLAKVIDGGLTADNVGAMGQLCQLYRDMEAHSAEREFRGALAALQADIAATKIVATKGVPNKDGSLRYKYAPYEEIMEAVAPFLARHGFAITFTTRYTEGTPQRIVAVCTLSHRGGHHQANEFAVRISAPPMASDAQADGSSRTYAKRGALCDALNISIEHDDDARAEGDYITAEQAADLERRIRACKADVALFLKFAGATTFAEIRTAKLKQVLGMLARKEAHVSATSTVPKPEWPVMYDDA